MTAFRYLSRTFDMIPTAAPIRLAVYQFQQSLEAQYKRLCYNVYDSIRWIILTTAPRRRSGRQNSSDDCKRTNNVAYRCRNFRAVRQWRQAGVIFLEVFFLKMVLGLFKTKYAGKSLHMNCSHSSERPNLNHADRR